MTNRRTFRHGRRARHRRHKERSHLTREAGYVRYLKLPPSIARMSEEVQEARQRIIEALVLPAHRSPLDVALALPREFGTGREELLRLSELLHGIEGVK